MGWKSLVLAFAVAPVGYLASNFSAQAEPYEHYDCVIEAEVQNWKGQGTGTYLRDREWTLASDGYDLGSLSFTISEDGASGHLEFVSRSRNFSSDDVMPERFSVTRTEYARVFVTHITTYVIAALPNVTALSVVENDGTGYAAFGSCTLSHP